MRCPSCGAPPPPGFMIPPGQFSYMCQYCGQSSVQGTPMAPPPQAPPTGPIYIVQHHHYVDDDDDDDVPHHHYQAAIVHANAARSVSWIIWVVVVLVVSLGGSGAAFMRCSNNSKLLSSLVWDGSQPLQCGGNENISVNGVVANFNAGTAIVAAGNCHIRCTDCKISAPTVIEASGNADVTIVNGSVKGTTFLAEASGNAHVNISGNVIASGPVHQSANAKISAPAPTEPPPAPVPTTPAAKAVKPTPPSGPIAKPKTK